MSIIEDMINKETLDYAKRTIKVKNECENIKKFLLGLGYDKWGPNTKIIVNHQDKIILFYTKTNSTKNRDSVLTALIEAVVILPGYTLIYGYLKTARSDEGTQCTMV